MFPSFPDWDGIHPAMVQFAIVSPWVGALLLLVSLFARQTWRTWAGASLLVMTLGVVASWLAVASGHAAGQLVDKTPAVSQAIARHEALGLQARNLFTLLAVAFAALMLLPTIIHRVFPTAARISVYALFLLVYFGGIVLVASTASQGGRLVHEMGVRAMVEPAATVAESTAPATEQSPAVAEPAGRPANPARRN